MKTKKLAVALGLSAAMILPAFQASASANTSHGEWTSEKTVVVSGTSIVGAIAAGPIGFVLGLAAGEWLGDNVNQAKSAEQMQLDQVASRAELDQLRKELMLARQNAELYQGLAMESLQLNIMFPTAGSELSAGDRDRLINLTELLKRNPELIVNLGGYADPRGTDAFNLNLSGKRAESVRKFFVEAGIDSSRITTNAYGSRMSRAGKGDMDAYAKERMVSIDLQEKPRTDRLAVK